MGQAHPASAMWGQAAIDIPLIAACMGDDGNDWTVASLVALIAQDLSSNPFKL